MNLHKTTAYFFFYKLQFTTKVLQRPSVILLIWLIWMYVALVAAASAPATPTLTKKNAESFNFPLSLPANRRLAALLESIVLTEKNFIVRPNGEKLYILQPNTEILVNSPIYLVQLAHHENGLYGLIRDFYQRELTAGGLREPGVQASKRWILPVLEAYIKDYEESVILTKMYQNLNWNDLQDLVSKHPLLVFRMIFRFVVYLHNIPNYVLHSDFGHVGELLLELDYKKSWPTMVEYQETVEAFLRIQHTYNMKTVDLASGNVMGNQIPISLSLEQCLDIAIYASKDKMYSWALEWLELARIRVEQGRPKYTALTYESLKENVLLLLENEIIQHDDYILKGENVTKWGHYHFQTLLYNNETLLRPKDRISLRDISYWKNGSFIYRELFDVYRYWNLCSGKSYQTEAQKSNLYCYYERSVHAFFFIGPVKIEFLSKSPEIIKIYDIIGPKVVESMVSSVWNEIKPSHVVDLEHPGKSKKSKVRTSVEGWIWEPPKLLNNLARKIEFLTGNKILKERSSELFLLAGYSFGGHYECHMDSFENTGEYGDRGDRIATMMFYLNEPQKGGNTAFPNLGIFVRPVQYSGVFWYNILPSGSRDLRTHHCACPVVLGHKWISTKWIRHYEQFLGKKCDLDQNASFKFNPKNNES